MKFYATTHDWWGCSLGGCDAEDCRDQCWLRDCDGSCDSYHTVDRDQELTTKGWDWDEEATE